MTFRFSQRSIARLTQCHPDLRRVIEEAIKLTPVDFTVTETLRTMERQKHLVSIGASKTLDSRHLPDPSDGLSRALDFVPLDKGMPSYHHWPLFYQVAGAVRQAAKQQNVPVVWGCIWDRTLNELGEDLEIEALEYAARQKAKGRKVFADGPHVELCRKAYP